jgi:hypothetical protein
MINTYYFLHILLQEQIMCTTLHRATIQVGLATIHVHAFKLRIFVKSFASVVANARIVFLAAGVRPSAIRSSAPVIWRSGNVIPIFVRLVALISSTYKRFLVKTLACSEAYVSLHFIFYQNIFEICINIYTN